MVFALTHKHVHWKNSSATRRRSITQKRFELTARSGWDGAVPAKCSDPEMEKKLRGPFPVGRQICLGCHCPPTPAEALWPRISLNLTQVESATPLIDIAQQGLIWRNMVCLWCTEFREHPSFWIPSFLGDSYLSVCTCPCFYNHTIFSTSHICSTLSIS